MGSTQVKGFYHSMPIAHILGLNIKLIVAVWNLFDPARNPQQLT